MTRPAACITTARLTLRRPRPADIKPLQALNSHALVTRWLHWNHGGDTPHQHYDLARYATKWRSGEEYFWIIEAHCRARVVGYLASRRTSTSADLGFVIDPDFWGNGYATEAATAVVSQIRRLHGLKILVGVCDARNLASAKVMQHAGLIYQGIARNFLHSAQIPHQRFDACLFKLVITKHDKQQYNYTSE
ncbi:MAG: GNAT family N-acetyltransferase [Pseudomonadota bacterium]